MHYYTIQNKLRHKDFTATNKALIDAEEIIKNKWGGQELALIKSYGNIICKLINLVYLFLKIAVPHFLGGISNKDNILFLYPDSSYKIKVLLLLHRIKKFKLIMFINDFEFLRQGGINTKRMFSEIGLCMKCDKIIVPNEGAYHILHRYYGIEENSMTSVGIWDYLHRSNIKIHAVIPRGEILYVGNLDKSDFIYGLKNLPLTFDLIGQHQKTFKATNLHYLGKFDSEELPDIITDYKWGLVWDGSGYNKLPNYLRFNNPHKMGLYIAAGIPVIVWAKSGQKAFVDKYHCGITIERLDDIPTALRKAEKNYADMKKNAMEVSKLVRTGYFLGNTLKSI